MPWMNKNEILLEATEMGSLLWRGRKLGNTIAHWYVKK